MFFHSYASLPEGNHRKSHRKSHGKMVGNPLLIQRSGMIFHLEVRWINYFYGSCSKAMSQITGGYDELRVNQCLIIPVFTNISGWLWWFMENWWIIGTICWTQCHKATIRGWFIPTMVIISNNQPIIWEWFYTIHRNDDILGLFFGIGFTTWPH